MSLLAMTYNEPLIGPGALQTVWEQLTEEKEN